MTPHSPSRSERFIDAGMAMARKIFEKRGNHTEVHLNEGELAGFLAIAIGNGVEAGHALGVGSTRSETKATGPLKLDTDREVFFYEQDHYYLSNFSAFRLRWAGYDFETSEHAYHWYRFNGVAQHHQQNIVDARSAHDAFRYAQEHKADQRRNWDAVKVGVMRDILRAKAAQHEYVRRKLLQTGDRELVENSWRDPFWGWGEDRKGKNMLGKLWMEVRAELRSTNG